MKKSWLMVVPLLAGACAPAAPAAGPAPPASAAAPRARFVNPETVAKPVGPYSHLAVVAPGAQIVAVAGQVGLALNGSIAADVESQYEQALKNVVTLLASEGLSPRDIIKMNTYVVRPMEVARFREIRRATLGDAAPASTFVYVPRLVSEQFLVEVEAWAAR